MARRPKRHSPCSFSQAPSWPCSATCTVAGRRRAEGSVVGLKDSESQLLGLVNEIEKVMEVAPVAILVALDPACQRITGNRAASELYGVHGKLNFSLTPPQGEQPAPHRYFSGGKELCGEDLPMQRAVAQNREVRDLEMQVFRQDGGQITLFGGAIPLHDKHGRVRGCIAAFVDITARRKAEQSLHKLSQAVEQSPVNVIITDTNGNIEYVNRRFIQVTGYTSAEVLGKNPRILKSGHTSQEQYRALWQTIKGGGEWFGGILEQGEGWIPVLGKGADHLDQGRDRPDYALSGRERRHYRAQQAEDALHQMRLQLTHVARLSTLGEMAAELAHELNHPLYAILNYAKACRNLLAEEGPPDLDNLREWNEEIADIALSAGEVVKRLRSFARRGESARTACRIEEVVEEALRFVAVETRRARVTVETLLAAAVPAFQADRVQIQQVFVNLLNNAMEAMQTVPAKMRQITLQTVLGDGAIEVVVSDRGVGLPPGCETKIFEPYVTTKPQGLGMGLSIVRTIVEAHGGRLWATANPEGGAAFHFTLPLDDGGHFDGV